MWWWFPAAFANGQSTHVWITLTAAAELQDVPELAAFVQDPAVQSALVNGAMFPDGGYAVGDGYGEMAHWEPFQLAWRDHVLEVCGAPPYTGDCSLRAAFWLGLASHGMADQYFDANYLDRSRSVYDATSDWANTSMDEATDVLWVADHGPVELPERWLPVDELAETFGTLGYTVDPALLTAGQDRLVIAIGYVALAAAQPDTVARYRAQYPWATAHLDDTAIPGRPEEEARVVAAYWKRLWAQLHGAPALEPPLIYVGQKLGGQSEDPADIESRVSLVFARGLAVPGFRNDFVTIVDEEGTSWPTASDVYYGDTSHVVNVSPTEGWGVDQVHTVSLAAGIPTFDGLLFSEGATTFSTAPEALPPPTTDETSPKGCGQGSGAFLMLPWLAWNSRRRPRVHAP